MSLPSESVLNSVLIEMGCSFLQYISDAWPWVDPLSQSIQDQVMVISARQRQDVADIADLLTEREHHIDFGTFPTEYTDLQFLALDAILDYIQQSQTQICERLASALTDVRNLDDQQAVDLLSAVEIRQKEATAALQELHTELTRATSAP